MKFLPSMFLIVCIGCTPSREDINAMRLKCAAAGMKVRYVFYENPQFHDGRGNGSVQKVWCEDSDGAWYEPGDVKK